MTRRLAALGALAVYWCGDAWAHADAAGANKPLSFFDPHDFSDASTIYSVGAGFRYMIARKLGVSIDLDVAHSKGQNAFYIQVGSAWR